MRCGTAVTLTQRCGQPPDDLAPEDRLITVNSYVPLKKKGTRTVIALDVAFKIWTFALKAIVSGVIENADPFGA
jgi:hypothetical protein